jgi:hypothetical protein
MLAFGLVVSDHLSISTNVPHMASIAKTALAGSICDVCKKGTLALEASLPAYRSAGQTKRSFRCSECQQVAVDRCDDRFL